jgi:MOB kinase activator 1
LLRGYFLTALFPCSSFFFFFFFPKPFFLSTKDKTFKPKKRVPKHQSDLQVKAKATLGSGNLRMAVVLPQGEDRNEWLAVNTVDFFNQINLLYGSITEFCTGA